MATYVIELDFNLGDTWEDITDYVIADSFIRKRTLYNDNLKPTVNTCKFQIKPTSTLANKFLSSTVDIEARITKDGSEYFTGYIRENNFALKFNQQLQPIEVECVDASWKLKKKINTSFAWQDYTIGDTGDTTDTQILYQLLSLAGLGDSQITYGSIGDTIDYFVHNATNPKQRKTYEQLLAGLLFEYGYTYSFDENGYFTTYEMFPSSVTSGDTFDNSNIYGEVEVKDRATKYEQVEVSWKPLKSATDVVIFRDSTNGNDSYQCNIEVAAGEYYPNVDGDTTYANFVYEDKEIVYTSNHSLDADYDGDISVTTEFYNPKTAGITFQNGHGSLAKNITKFDIKGDVIYFGDEHITIDTDVVATEKIAEVETSYIDTEANAKTLTNGLMTHFKYGDKKYTFKSKTEVALGDVVTLLDENTLGFQTEVVITAIEDKAKKEYFTYTCEGIVDYSPRDVVLQIMATQPAAVNTGPIEVPDNVVTYDDIENGYGDTATNASTVPEATLWSDISASKQNITLSVLPQTVANGYTNNLTNFYRWEAQVSGDTSDWYSLEFDGSDWKGGDSLTAFYNPAIVHTNIPNVETGTGQSARTLYYRVRTATQVGGVGDTYSAWSSIREATTQPVLSWYETIPPLNGEITDTTGDSRATVLVTFTAGDDTHSGLYAAGEYSGLAGHKIYRKDKDGSDVRIVGDIKDASQTTFRDTFTTSGDTYFYGISAYDVNANESIVDWYGDSTRVTYTMEPDNVGTIEAKAFPNEITIKWATVDGEAPPYTYNVERATSLTNWATWEEGLEETTYGDTLELVTEFSTIEEYRYRVTALDKYGNESPTPTATSTLDRATSYGTWIPTTPTITFCKPSHSTISLMWDSQTDLIDFSHFEVTTQRAGDSGWYEIDQTGLGFGDSAEVTSVSGTFLLHVQLPYDGDTATPLGDTWNYRIKRVTQSGAESANATPSATTTPIGEGSIKALSISETKIGDSAISTRTIQAEAITANQIKAGEITGNHIAGETIVAGNIGAGEITANEIDVNSLNAMIANVNQYLTIGDSTIGFIAGDYTLAGGPTNGDNRFYVDRDNIQFDVYDGADWITQSKWGELSGAGYSFWTKNSIKIGSTEEEPACKFYVTDLITAQETVDSNTVAAFVSSVISQIEILTNVLNSSGQIVFNYTGDSYDLGARIAYTHLDETMAFELRETNKFLIKEDSINPLVQILSTNGSYTAPDYSFFGDNDTGMYREGANEIGWVLGGTRELLLNNSGLYPYGTLTIGTSGNYFSAGYITTINATTLNATTINSSTITLTGLSTDDGTYDGVLTRDTNDVVKYRSAANLAADLDSLIDHDNLAGVDTNRHRQIFVQSSTPTGASGDMWIDTT